MVQWHETRFNYIFVPIPPPYSKTPAVLNKSVPVNSCICFVDYDVWPMVTRVFEWQLFLFKTAAGETDTPFAV